MQEAALYHAPTRFRLFDRKSAGLAHPKLFLALENNQNDTKMMQYRTYKSLSPESPADDIVG